MLAGKGEDRHVVCRRTPIYICRNAPSGVGRVLVDDLIERQDERRALMHLLVLWVLSDHMAGNQSDARRRAS